MDIRTKLACNDAFVTRWTKAFEFQGLAGLVSLHPGRAPKQPVEKLEARVLNKTLKHRPRDGSTHWSSRKLAAELGDVSFSAVQRIWRKHGLQPHRLERHMVSNDPDFETKAADVIGLYLNPPAHAAVFCVDEKTAIQALDCKDRMLPLSPGRAESHGFEYKRNGALSLFAALNTATGEVLGKTAARHTSEQFVAFLEEVVASQPEQREIHVICDNVSSHKTGLVADFLAVAGVNYLGGQATTILAGWGRGNLLMFSGLGWLFPRSPFQWLFGKRSASGRRHRSGSGGQATDPARGCPQARPVGRWLVHGGRDVSQVVAGGVVGGRARFAGACASCAVRRR
jgi:hypothetical protein